MAGTQIGGVKAALTNKKKHGPDFYKEIGRKGGAASGSGGFAYWKSIGRSDLIKQAGSKGGTISRKRSIHNESTSDHPDITSEEE